MRIIFVILLTMISSSFVEAQTNVPRTVTDFYLGLPMSYVDDTAGASERRKRITVEDLENGYLKLKPTADMEKSEYTEIALFKKSAGGYVVGVNTVECTETCSSYPRFLERRSDRWTDVGARVFPVTRETDLLQYQLKKLPPTANTIRFPLFPREPICRARGVRSASDIRVKARTKSLIYFLFRGTVSDLPRMLICQKAQSRLK